MSLPASGPIALSTIQAEFGGSAPISLSEYYAGGSYVPLTAAVPTSGQVSMSAYHGKSAANSLHLYDPNTAGTADMFGYSFAFSDSYAVVGAPASATLGANSGKAYVFDASGTLLSTLARPTVVGTTAGDYFGYSVAITGNYALVGAANEDTSAGTTAGKVHIFDLATGTYVAALLNPNAYSTAAGDSFGQYMVANSTHVAVAAVQEDSAAGASVGCVYLFTAGTWALLRTVKHPNTSAASAVDAFGSAMALYGDYLIVGAPTGESVAGTSSGVAYIVRISTGTALKLSDPNAYSTATGDYFGSAVAASSQYAVVSAPLEDSDDGTSSGKVYVFNITTGALITTLSNPNPYGTAASDHFGQSMALSETHLAVSAYLEDETNWADSGKVYVYETANWTLVRTLDNPNAISTPYSDNFGFRVALYGQKLAVCGTNFDRAAEPDNSGPVYVFTLD